MKNRIILVGKSRNGTKIIICNSEKECTRGVRNPRIYNYCRDCLQLEDIGVSESDFKFIESILLDLKKCNPWFSSNTNVKKIYRHYQSYFIVDCLLEISINNWAPTFNIEWKEGLLDLISSVIFYTQNVTNSDMYEYQSKYAQKLRT